MSYFKEYNIFIKYLLDNINSLECNLILYSNESEKILFSTLERKNVKYFALRDINFTPENQKKGRLTEILNIIENSKRPVMIDDIINPLVEGILIKRNWSKMIYYKNGNRIISYIKS